MTTTQLKSAYTHCVFDPNSGRTISWHKSQAEADKALERWQRRCEKRGVNCSAVVMKPEAQTEQVA